MPKLKEGEEMRKTRNKLTGELS
jgi:hypothetical protein